MIDQPVKNAPDGGGMTKTLPMTMPNAVNFARTPVREYTRSSAARVRKNNIRHMEENSNVLQQQNKQGAVMNELDQAYAQGFSDKCAAMGVEPEVLLKQAKEPTRLGALGMSLVPGGSMIYPAVKAAPGRGWEGAARGLAYGAGGSIAGLLGGSLSGGLAGSGVGALVSLLSKGKIPMPIGARSGSVIGGRAGTIIGGAGGYATGAYHAAKRVAPSHEKAKMKIKELIRSMRG